MNVDAASGTIPDGWKIAAIGDVCKVVSGSTPKTNVSEYWNGDIPWLTPNDLSKNRSKVVVQGERSITKNGFDSCSTQMVPEGSVLFTSRAPIGYVAIAGAPMCTNQGFKSAVPSEVIGTEFLYWQLQNLTDDIRSRASGTTFLEISGRGFAATNLVIPPLSEQEKIVEILEEQFSRLDAAVASVRLVREKALRFRRSLLHAAFTGALTGHDLSSGKLPNDWRLLKIADFASVKGGKRLPKGTQWSEVETNHPYIRATDIKNGVINEENLVYVPEKIWPAISRYIVATNDVIITIAGTIGSLAVVPETLNNANLTENAAKICHLQNVLARFLLLYLMSPETQTVISGLSTSTTQAKLALFRIESIEVPIPSLIEQRKIVEIVDAQISILDQSLSVVDAVERKVSALRRSLLHSAFTGELTKEWREGAHV